MTKKLISERRSDHSSAAAEEVAGNEDLIREIFLYLPVRSLIKFKSVSKQWFPLISDPQFAGDHTRRTKNPRDKVPSGIFFYNSFPNSQELESVSLHDAPIQPSRVRVRVPSLAFLGEAAAGATIKVTNSCNGLLLCSFTSRSSDSKVKVDYCVCNPTTKNYKILPQPCLMSPQKIIIYSLAFDPSESPHYRVICVKSRSRLYYDCPCQIDIYSSENGSWRASSCQFRARFGLKFCSGCYWNGEIHWSSMNVFRYSCLVFNINAESMKIDLMPSLPQSTCEHRVRYFGECNGHLHLIYVRTPCAKLFRVLEKDKDTFIWSVKYRVHINRLTSTFPEIARKAGPYAKHYGEVEYAFSVLSVVKGEKEEDSALVLIIPGKVISYNFHHKTAKVLRELPSREVYTSSQYYINGFHYIETLSSV